MAIRTPAPQSLRQGCDTAADRGGTNRRWREAMGDSVGDVPARCGMGYCAFHSL